MQGFLALAVGMALLAAAPDSTDTADPGYIAAPIWLIEPAAAQVPADLPRSGYASYVPLFCAVHGDALSACRSFGPPITAEYLSAAVEAAQTARIAPQDGEGIAVEGRDVFLFINFPGNLDAAASSIAPPATLGVMWLQRPSGASASYPPAARAFRVLGNVVLDCLITPDNPPTCTVAAASPRGFGFEAAALQASRAFQIEARTPDGRSTAGGRLRVPFNFHP